MKVNRKELFKSAKYKIINNLICFLLPLTILLIPSNSNQYTVILGIMAIAVTFLVWGIELMKILADILCMNVLGTAGEYVQTDSEKLAGIPGYNYRLVIKNDKYAYYHSGTKYEFSVNDIIELKYMKRSKIIANASLIKSK